MKRKFEKEAVLLLQRLIEMPSPSREEDKTADIIAAFLADQGVVVHSYLNNVWAFNKYYDPSLPTILLNSHHDTVKPNLGYTRNPYTPDIEDGMLYGLGSNDAGGCLVSLLAAFLYFYEQKNLSYNLLFAATAEEEISGKQGMEAVFPRFGEIDFAIVGEPTQMNMAIAEKGLMVLDCVANGKSGHAAREEGQNAIYKAMKDIEWLKNYRFAEESELLGPVKMSVTMINAGTQHNVVPDTCAFTVDVRLIDKYSPEETLDIIKTHVSSDVNPRSMRLRPSFIDKDHPVVKVGLALGLKVYGSPTTSDQALIPVPSLKIGPGDSARSHTADEFVYLKEIEEGLEVYIQILEKLIIK